MRNMNLQQYYCIKCGQPIQFEWDEKLLPTQGKCINLECVEFNKPWAIVEHKDNQNWAVRHIRALESENQAMKEQIVGFMQQNVDLATKMELLIQNLEKALNVDVNVDGTIQQ